MSAITSIRSAQASRAVSYGRIPFATSTDRIALPGIPVDLKVVAIPKVLHQTWKDRRVPDVFAGYVASWRANHPDWEYRLWTDDDNRQLIAEHYAWFLETYDRYPKPIQRADAVRYFILHKFGGMYVDLDFLSCSPMTPLLAGEKCVLGVEPPEHCRQFGVPQLVCNALMAAVPEHPFFETVIRRLPEFVDHVECQQPVLSSTGPLMLTRVYERFPAKDSMSVLPSRHFYPLTLDQATEFRLAGRTGVDLSGSVAIHLYYGNWWKPSWWDLQRRLSFAVAAAARSCTRILPRSGSRRDSKATTVGQEAKARRAA